MINPMVADTLDELLSGVAYTIIFYGFYGLVGMASLFFGTK
jgi:hypothetical protein